MCGWHTYKAVLVGTTLSKLTCEEGAQNHGDVLIRLKKENAERFMCQLLTVMDCGRTEVSINI